MVTARYPALARYRGSSRGHPSPGLGSARLPKETSAWDLSSPPAHGVVCAADDRNMDDHEDGHGGDKVRAGLHVVSCHASLRQ